MNSKLKALGLEGDPLALYRAVLRSAPLGLEGYAQQLGWSQVRAEDALGQLTDLALVALGGDGALRADHPRSALDRIVRRKESEIEELWRELVETRSQVWKLAGEGRQPAGQGRNLSWEVLSGASASAVVEELMLSANGPIRAVTVTIESGPGAEAELVDLMQRVVAAGESDVRTIYPSSALSDPRARAWMETFAAVGEQQRLVDNLATEFCVFGDLGVVAAETWGDLAGSFVAIREPMLIAAFGALFDALWALGQPAPSLRATQREEFQAIIELLSMGLKDEAVARHLGLGLRTTRRRIAALMDELGVETRFQLGMAVARRQS